MINYVPNQSQTDGTLTGLFFVMALLSAVGSIVRLTLMYFYKFTEKEFDQAVLELQRRKGLQQLTEY